MIKYNDDGKVEFKCHRYSKDSQFPDQVSCSTGVNDCPLYDTRIGLKIRLPMRIVCDGNMRLEWTKFLLFRSLISDNI